MATRGTYNFEVNQSGSLLYSMSNIELLKALWLDREILKIDELGPGDSGDFDNGAWHVACHLVAGCGVLRSSAGNLMWLEISYNPTNKLYEPTLTLREKGKINTINLNSDQAQILLKNSELLGFVEGTSEGKISAHGIKDDEMLFNNTPRQLYDQPPGSDKEGGKVWEHWCTTRDIRNASSFEYTIGLSVLNSYISLASVCGDKFAPIIARGRTDYCHPKQLEALIEAGFTSLVSAQHKLKPSTTPEEVSLLLQEATPESGLIAAERLDWNESIQYYMFSRRIERWNDKDVF